MKNQPGVRLAGLNGGCKARTDAQSLPFARAFFAIALRDTDATLSGTP